MLVLDTPNRRPLRLTCAFDLEQSDHCPPTSVFKGGLFWKIVSIRWLAYCEAEPGSMSVLSLDETLLTLSASFVRRHSLDGFVSKPFSGKGRWYNITTYIIGLPIVVLH